MALIRTKIKAPNRQLFVAFVLTFSGLFLERHLMFHDMLEYNTLSTYRTVFYDFNSSSLFQWINMKIIPSISARKIACYIRQGNVIKLITSCKFQFLNLMADVNIKGNFNINDLQHTGCAAKIDWLLWCKQGSS